MLVEWICDLIQKLFFSIFGGVNIPPLPDDFSSSVLTFISTITDSAGNLISLLIPWRIITIGLPIVMVVVGVKYVYQLVMWILRKIPMLGLS